MEKLNTEIENLSDILATQRMVYFIETRNIKPQDLLKIEALLTILKSDREYFSNILPGDLHNFFHFEKEKSSQELERMKQRKNIPAFWNKFLDILIYFTDSYDYMTTDHLLRTIRNIRLENKALFTNK